MREINSIDLVTSIEDCAIVADACSFKIDEGRFVIEAKSLNSAMSEFSGDEVKMQAENCKAKYSIEYLQKFMKGSRLSEKTNSRKRSRKEMSTATEARPTVTSTHESRDVDKLSGKLEIDSAPTIPQMVVSGMVRNRPPRSVHLCLPVR